MIITSATVRELEAKGWVQLWGEDTDKLERLGVPMRLVQSNDLDWPSSIPMAPKWSVLIASWTSEVPAALGAVEDVMHDLTVAFVVAHVYARPEEEQAQLAEAFHAAYLLGGRPAVNDLLSAKESR